MCSVILAGFLYFLNLEFSYDHLGVVFFFKGLNINYIVLLVLSPIILFLYVKQFKTMKEKQQFYYNVKIVFKNNKELDLVGYLDSANKLVDPVTRKKIIVVENSVINKRFIRSPIYVPYKTVNYKGLLKCFSPRFIVVDNHKYDNYLLGLYNGTFNIEGINCILNASLMEDLHV
jgi:hypothetical protein